jgi:membrane associated rhomboid family serine protease
VLPLRSAHRPQRRPWITWALIAMNVAIFVFSLARSDTTFPGYDDASQRVPVNGFDSITWQYGFMPCELGDECERPDRGEVYPAGTSELPEQQQDTEYVRVPDVAPLLTLLASMFMHGSWVHLIGNMLFLWIFGPRLEDAMPRLAYLLFYLVCGLAADVSQWAVDTASDVPNIGASGAIAGLLGGFLILYPRERLLTALPIVPFFYLAEIPAVLVLVSWIALQLLSGSAALVGPDAAYGIAYFAHIGGFFAGLLLARPLATRWRRRRREARAVLAV